MPVKRCVRKGKSGHKFGDKGKCFVGRDGKDKAKRQGRAIKANQARRNR